MWPAWSGVSRATVSYVLNNARAVRISEPTRRRVREAARELGYVPHAAARSLRAGHSRMVLMPAPAFPVGPLYSRFINELQAALCLLDYTVVQYGTVGAHDDEAARAWAELRPVAVLVPGAGLGPEGSRCSSGPARGPSSRSAPRRWRARTRCSWTTTSSDTARAPTCSTRGAAGSASSCRGGGAGHVLRAAPGGVLAAVRGTDATVVELLPLAHEEEAAAGLAARWRELGLDAVFTYNDEYAMLLMRALQDAGIRIPEETAVVGADDLMLGRLLRPRLSTVQLELPSGQELADLVDRAVRDPGRRRRRTRCWGRR